MNNDKQLIADAKSNPQEFSKLYLKYYPQIYKYLLLRTKDKELADDLTSQTFIRAFDKYQDYHFQDDNFGGWLFKIGHNLMVDHYRKNKLEMYNFEIENNASKEDVLHNVHYKLLAEEIYKLLDDFTPQEKEIILLKLISDLTFKEIAELLGENENTVKTKYFRNLKIIKSNSDKLTILLILLFSTL